MMTQLVHKLSHDQNLLAEVVLSKQALAAQKNLIAMINQLPPNSPLITYLEQLIAHSYKDMVQVNAFVVDGKIQVLRPIMDFSTKPWGLIDVSTDAGVYV
jgi:hypothetical protein